MEYKMLYEIIIPVEEDKIIVKIDYNYIKNIREPVIVIGPNKYEIINKVFIDNIITSSIDEVLDKLSSLSTDQVLFYIANFDCDPDEDNELYYDSFRIPGSISKIPDSISNVKFTFCNCKGDIWLDKQIIRSINIIDSYIPDMHIDGASDRYYQLELFINNSEIGDLFINYSCMFLQVSNNSEIIVTSVSYSRLVVDINDINCSIVNILPEYSFIDLRNSDKSEEEYTIDNINMEQSSIRFDRNINIASGSCDAVFLKTNSKDQYTVPNNITPKIGLSDISGVIDLYKIVSIKGHYTYDRKPGYIAHLRTLEDSKIMVPISTHNMVRVDKAEVVEIYDKNHNPAEGDFTNFIYTKNIITYTKGTIVYADSLDTNVFNDCSHGINAYTSFETALKEIELRAL